MEFTTEQKRIVVSSIRKLDALQGDYDKCFEVYDSAKVKVGFAIFASGMLFLGVLSGNYEIQECIGTLGVGSLPIIFISAIIYFLNARKQYNNQITKRIKIEKSLFDLGVSYRPMGKYYKEPCLIVIDTREEVDVNSLIKGM
ncbi:MULTISPECIES: hypothetical protein [Psychromonas]|uniref:hypothetical protein n=1 Tax=Psychromonas TaxID=67572 RepID=UPI002FD04A81